LIITYASDNFGYWLSIRAARDAQRVAVVEGASRTTYGELNGRAARVAGALWSSGVRPGDRVAVALKNRIEFLEVLFGAARIGAIFVPLNFRLAAEQVAYALEDSGSVVVVTQLTTAPAVAQALTHLAIDVRVISVDGPEANYESWRDAAEPVDFHPVEPGDALSIIYTSGTTGPPKGAVLTHEGAMTNIHNYLFEWDLRRDDATLVVNPIFHVVLYILCVPLLYKGGKVVLMEDFDADGALHLAEDEQITVWFAIPTAWQMIIDSPEFGYWDRRRVRFIGSGGAACPSVLMDRIEQLGLPYRQGYGLSESTSSATTMTPEDQAGRRGSIGRAFLYVETQIADNDDREVTAHEVGEIQLRGRNICDGYWNKPAETIESFSADGWFRTGDLGYADEEGFIWIVDRKKDIIISGGENIGSIEVEQVVLSHPAIAQASVIGIPHPRWGETPCAVIVLKPCAAVTPEELIEHCRNRLAHFKCPTKVVVVGELPMTANGKVVKASLRKQVAVMEDAETPAP
jgi:fatty-acyl-CoA synthase